MASFCLCVFVTSDVNGSRFQLAPAAGTGAQAGREAHYMLHWVSTRGDKGPWTETASATIAG
jgi:hypothetical protein